VSEPANTNRPTPETDAADRELEYPTMELDWVVAADFARRLERERDESREQLDGARRAAMAAIGRANRAVDESMLANAKAEQANARADKAEAIIAETLRALPVGCIPAHTPESIPGRVADLAREAGEQCARADKAEAERDRLLARLNLMDDELRGARERENKAEHRCMVLRAELQRANEERTAWMKRHVAAEAKLRQADAVETETNEARRLAR
jgi:hypothetical protein